MECLKDSGKNCHSKVITPEFEEYPACLRGQCSDDLTGKARPLIRNPMKKVRLQHIFPLMPFPKLSKKQITAAVDEALKDENATEKERRDIVNKLLALTKGRRHIRNPIPTDEEWRQYCNYAERVRRRREEAERKAEKPGMILIKNPTKSQLQRIADFFQRPVAIPVDLKKEAEAYERFHHQKPDSIVKASHPAIPRSLIALGRLESVVYKKYSDDQSYIHDLKHGILAADRKGKLYIIGDKAKITERGIVG